MNLLSYSLLTVHCNAALPYNPALSLWLSVDPLSDKYPGVSPYVYCGDNPVMIKDPDGRDIWEIDDEGRIVNHMVDETKDAFYFIRKSDDGTYARVKNANGDEIGVSFQYGTIISHRSISYCEKGQQDNYDIYKVRGDENGTKLFEFIANTVQEKEMEVAQAMTGIAGDKGLNFVAISHLKPEKTPNETISSDPCLAYMVNGRLKYGYTIRELNHSHPLDSRISDADRNFACNVQAILSARGLPIPSFNIYDTHSQKKIRYY